MKWMIYGANGYTGKLIATEAKKQGLEPVLAGRSLEKVKELGNSLGLEYRAFDLSAPRLDDIDLVLHCAGPFSQTSRPMADALISRGKHYLDITGEIQVFEALFARRGEALASGSMVVPGVGFDVVPTDCLAQRLKELMPDATHLEMAMSGTSSLSPGTVKSMIEGFSQGGWIRREGKLTPVPSLYETKEIPFPNGLKFCASIPWGDVCTAFYSTGIPNITFFAETPKQAVLFKPVLPIAQKLMEVKAIQNFLKDRVEGLVKGPTQEHWEKGFMQIYGKVTNAKGEKIEKWLRLPEGYWFTMLASIHIVKKILEGNVKPGVWTPSLAFGSKLIEEMQEVRFVEVP